MAKRKTNVQFVKSVMEFSEYGALAQAFVMQAIEQYAKSVAASSPEKLDTPFVSGQAWHGIANELLGKLETHYKS